MFIRMLKGSVVPKSVAIKRMDYIKGELDKLRNRHKVGERVTDSRGYTDSLLGSKVYTDLRNELRHLKKELK